MKRLMITSILILSFTELAFGQWYSRKSADEMTGEKSSYAYSQKTKPNRIMDTPYSNVTAFIGVGCDKSDKWVYFGFSGAPNLTGNSTMSGYDIIRTRIKWDNEVENIRLRQDWGKRFIHVEEDSHAISKLKSSNKVLLELEWYGEGSVYFEFDLTGSSKTMQKTFSECRSY